MVHVIGPTIISTALSQFFSTVFNTSTISEFDIGGIVFNSLTLSLIGTTGMLIDKLGIGHAALTFVQDIDFFILFAYSTLNNIAPT